MARAPITRRCLLGGAAAAAATTLTSLMPRTDAAAAPIHRFYLGTYTSTGGRGIAKGRLHAATGTPTVDVWTTAVPDASWLATAPNRATLYAISETAQGRAHALRLSSGGDPAPLNSQPTGNGPAHAAVSPDGEYLLTAMYGGGTVAVHPLLADGSVAPASDTKQHGTGSHAHQIVFAPDGTVLVVDLGLNAVVAYALAAGRLIETGRTAFPTGSGPRHLAFHPSGSYAYVANELNSTVTVCAYTGGVLTRGSALSTLPAGTSVQNFPGGVAVSPTGTHVYVSNRGHNSTAVFATSDGGSALTLVAAPSCNGNWPRHLSLDPAGARLYVANQRSGDISWFPIDPATGVPSAVAGKLAAIGVAQILIS
jgi:6-phosphogluconolactonase